jgi:hypothetical protein
MQSWAGVTRTSTKRTSKNTGLAVKTILALGGLCVLAVSTWATAPGKDEKAPAPQMVDSGSFGVFINGQRVATETFSIQQNGAGSSIVSRFKSESGAEKAEQTSEWQMTGSGDLRKYEWKEVSPGQSQALVVPNQDFLIERFKSSPQEKEHEQPFMVPTSSILLDDYVFIQREVLAWKFLASSCKQEKGALQCPLKQHVQFGVLNPHARSSMSVTLEFAGREKVTIRGVERQLNRLDLKSDSGDWALWLDDQNNQFKLQKMSSGDKTEVVRD